jgi:dolichyl-phosphate-mannose--protein O-mannosyl transferase
MSSVENNLVKSTSWKLNFLELAFFLVIAIVGIYAALNASISWDEEVEYRTYLINLATLQGLFNGDLRPYADLASYHDRYYGVGFHLISHGLGSSLHSLKSDLLIYSTIGSRLIWAHLGIFLAFLASGILFRACLLVLTTDRLISSLGMFAFLLWPYLFGHALMNVKDVPFLFVWLLCTYLALHIFINAREDTRSPWRWFAALGLVTGWLISIRVSGVLIFIEYFWLIIFWCVFNKPI